MKLIISEEFILNRFRTEHIRVCSDKCRISKNIDPMLHVPANVSTVDSRVLPLPRQCS
jgi:hypothetical protein